MSIVTRFAPSPTGHLHLGHAFSALIAWRRARAAGGRFLLRLEDIDPTRCRPEFATAILEDLAWLGLDWDGEVRVQSGAPRGVSRRAGCAGDARPAVSVLLHPCRHHSAIGRRSAYAGRGAALSGHLPVAVGGRACRPDRRRRAIRVAAGYGTGTVGGLAVIDLRRGKRKPPSVCHPEQFGDVVLARKDAPASYHLCVTHDDALQGVTLITRGADLKPATHLHRLLQALMGWPVPAYAHHALLTDASGRRLAKRDHAMTLRELRAQGHSPEAVRLRISG